MNSEYFTTEKHPGHQHNLHYSDRFNEIDIGSKGVPNVECFDTEFRLDVGKCCIDLKSEPNSEIIHTSIAQPKLNLNILKSKLLKRLDDSVGTSELNIDLRKKKYFKSLCDGCMGSVNNCCNGEETTTSHDVHNIKHNIDRKQEHGTPRLNLDVLKSKFLNSLVTGCLESVTRYCKGEQSLKDFDDGRRNIKIRKELKDDEARGINTTNYSTSEMSIEERNSSFENVISRTECHMCSVCEYATISSNNLKLHMRSHTGEKPYHCTMCQYAAAQPSTLKMHMRTHTGERPYKCNMCGYAAAQHNSLKIHMMNIHVRNQGKKIKENSKHKKQRRREIKW